MSRRSAVTLALLMLLGLGARIGYLLHATSQPGYEWADPDHYMLKGRLLAQDGEGWSWTFDAVRHSSYDQRFYVLPPAYPVFLSVFALFPGYPFTAQVAQVLLSTLTIALVFALGRELDSDRSGLLAAAIYACWVPNIIAVWSTMQESLYVPLVVLAFVLLLRAVSKRTDARPRDFALAGVVFGLATLTRSMSMYALPVLATVLVFHDWRERRRVLGNIAALFLGFFLLTAPYSLALSQHLGRATFVENHGSIFVVERYGGLEGDEPATLTETAAILIRGFLEAPVQTVGAWWATTRSVLHVNGGRLLQIYLGAATRTGALVAKWLTHLFGDIAFIVTLVLAPIGVALARHRGAATLALAWIVVNLGLVALSGFGGARLRAPFEPHLIALAAVVLSGSFRRVAATRLVPAGIAALVLAAIVLPQLPRSLGARADYGVHWPLKVPPKRSPMTGSAGFNVLPVDDAVRFYVRPRNPAGKTEVEVRLEGETVERVRLTHREHRFEIRWPHAGLAHVELTANDAATGEPVRLFVIVPKTT